MKKKHLLLILVVLLIFAITTTAFAKKGGETVEGVFVEVTQNEETGYCETLVVKTEDGELVTFTLPAEDDCSAYVDFVSGETYLKVSGDWNLNDEGEVVLDITSIALTEPEEEGEEGEGEGWGPGGVYCNGGKEDMHPVAKKISEKYKGLVDPAWAQEMACNGFGFGEVMLAIQTQLAYRKKNGEGELLPGEGCVGEEGTGDGEEGGETEGDAYNCNSLGNDAEQWLNHRKAGQGWGQIWKANDIVKHDKTDNPPPGWLKKQQPPDGFPASA